MCTAGPAPADRGAVFANDLADWERTVTTPRIRAADADRQKSVDRLARHFAEGRLDAYEYDERVRRAYASVYMDELPELFGDLPPEPIQAQAYETAWQQGYGPVDRRRSSGLRRTRPPARAGRMLVFALLTLMTIAAVAHGFFFPFPLIWIALFGLHSGRHGDRRFGPGPGPGR